MAIKYLMTKENKLECLRKINPFVTSLIFASKAGAYPNEARTTQHIVCQYCSSKRNTQHNILLSVVIKQITLSRKTTLTNISLAWK
jgi:hypothetical protein